jgi:hypothetical protein
MTRMRSWLNPRRRSFHAYLHPSPPVRAVSFRRREGSRSISSLAGCQSHHLIRQYADLLEVEKEWRWNACLEAGMELIHDRVRIEKSRLFNAVTAVTLSRRETYCIAARVN